MRCIAIFSFLVAISFELFSQDMTVQQTVNYINDKLAQNAIDEIPLKQYPYNTWHHTFKYNISVEANGNIVVNRTVSYFSDDTKPYGYITATQSFFSDNMKVSKFKSKSVQVERKEYFGLQIVCADISSDCIFNKTDVQGYSKKEKDILEEDRISTKENLSTSFINIGIENSSDVPSLQNAFEYLIKKISEDKITYPTPKSNDPFATKQVSSSVGKNEITTDNPNANVINMIKMSGGTYQIPVVINNVLKINFIFDSGASDVSISPDVALTLIKTGTVTSSDFVGTQKYVFADGTTADSKVFIIKDLKIGNKTVYNIRASISSSIDAPMLLGQSVLQKFGKFSIDNNAHTITID